VWRGTKRGLKMVGLVNAQPIMDIEALKAIM